MKLSKYEIPYPILGIKGAFNENAQVSHEMELRSTQTEYEITLKISIDDPEILELIRNGNALYACEVDCPKTFYRKTFKSQDNGFKVTIPKVSLVGNVQIFLSVVIEKDIQEYQNSNFNQRFYQGYKFNLSKGHMLAFLGETTFNADIKYNELTSLGSIIDVKPDPNSKFAYFEFNNELILIMLPQSEFDNFRKSNNHFYSDITHASIVQCALISALSSFKDYHDTLWAQTLKVRVQNDSKLSKFSNLDELSNKEIMEMVSIIMVNPNQRMFGKLSKLVED